MLEGKHLKRLKKKLILLFKLFLKEMEFLDMKTFISLEKILIKELIGEMLLLQKRMLSLNLSEKHLTKMLWLKNLTD
tara:strand:+ start:1933 stop:2163 length:231 start_codon:yes stop_codon:yes gene_type:complete